MKQQIKINETELKNLITSIINESMEENWFGRNFPFSAGRRGNNQLADAMNALKESDAKIQQFMQSAMSGSTGAGGVNVMKQGGNHSWMQPQNNMASVGANAVKAGMNAVKQQQLQQNVSEDASHALGAGLGLAFGGLPGALLGAGLAGLAGYFSVNNDFELLEEAFQLRADAYNYIARAASNGVDVSQISDTLLHIGPEANGEQPGQHTPGDPAQDPQNQQTDPKDPNNPNNWAKDWKTAQQEINQVVKGNWSNWPAQLKQAGWPDEKIAQYRKFANDPNQNAAGIKARKDYMNKQKAPQAATTPGAQAPQAATTTPTGIPYANPQANQTPQQTTAWGTPMSNLQQNQNLKESITRAIKSNLKKLK